MINQVFDDFCAFGRFELAVIETSGFIKGLGLVDFHRVLFGDWADLVQIVLARLDEAFD